jgi:hypothetical protein
LGVFTKHDIYYAKKPNSISPRLVRKDMDENERERLSGVDLRKKINWPRVPVKFLNNWPLQNSTGPRNIGP